MRPNRLIDADVSSSILSIFHILMSNSQSNPSDCEISTSDIAPIAAKTKAKIFSHFCPLLAVCFRILSVINNEF